MKQQVIKKTKGRTRVTTSISSIIPKEWHAEAHRCWLSGNRQEAVQIAVKHINTFGPDKPASLVLQLAYYLFLLNDYQSAVTILEYQFLRTPDHLEIALNLAVCYSRLNRHEEAVGQANAVLAMQPDNVVAWDILANALHGLGRLPEASMAGTRALELKDRASGSPKAGWILLPEGSPRNYARQDGKSDVIAFSLWGNNPRYLRGAIQNILLAPKFFPAWTLRFYIDDSLPSEFVGLMEKLGAKVIVQHGNHTLRERLCWRLQVANDPLVGHFLVRDVDSVFGNREAQAVDAWLASDLWFHVIRDWWTHSDLILAGMWGGVAGVLPSISAMLANYLPKHLETPNIDQWFLRDKVWAYIRQSCLVHDRCFRMPNSTQLPGPEPRGNYHIGQNEFAARYQEQEQFLRPWIEQYPCLGKIPGQD